MKKWLFLFSFFSLFANAHPHSFLDIKNKVLIVDDKLEGFQMSWWLDEITSAELIYEINNSANPEEAKQNLIDEMNSNAVAAHYFSELYDTQHQPIKFKGTPYQPSLEIQDNRVIYHFTLQLSSPYPLKGQSLRLSTFEPSYYLSMAYEKNSDLTVSEQSLCQVSLEEPKINQELRLYASRLDKTESPDENLSLGAQFAQKVRIVCD